MTFCVHHRALGHTLPRTCCARQVACRVRTFSAAFAHRPTAAPSCTIAFVPGFVPKASAFGKSAWLRTATLAWPFMPKWLIALVCRPSIVHLVLLAQQQLGASCGMAAAPCHATVAPGTAPGRVAPHAPSVMVTCPRSLMPSFAALGFLPRAPVSGSWWGPRPLLSFRLPPSRQLTCSCAGSSIAPPALLVLLLMLGWRSLSNKHTELWWAWAADASSGSFESPLFSALDFRSHGDVR